MLRRARVRLDLARVAAAGARFGDARTIIAQVASVEGSTMSATA